MERRINKNLLALICLLCAFPIHIYAGEGPDNRISIIPYPANMELLKNNNFIINQNTKIYIDKNDPHLYQLAVQLTDKLNKNTNYSFTPVQIKTQAVANAIILSKDNDPAIGDEGYKLDVSNKQVKIRGSYQGIFYGLQTFYQLLPLQRELVSAKIIEVPGVRILDYPRFGWRGFMLDVGRYFQSTATIKRYLDFLALHKINVFHWHLNDDQGWRIEIKKYPRLTQIGAWRKDSQLELSGKQMAFNPHGGFYTQDEIRDIVKYAADRFITVVPEIEMPGHCYAVLASYPELSCTGGPFEVSTAWKVHEDIYCAGNEKVFGFLEDVLDEIVELFPSPYIHIGGDEVPKSRWKSCPKCQKRIKENHLKNEEELQTYFISRIENFLQTKNRKIIGWDEITEGGLSPNATVMSWRGHDGAITAAKQNHDVIIANSKFTYLDHYQSEPFLEPLAWAGLVPNGYTTLQKSYSLNPIPPQLNKEEARHIIGLQAQLWLEYIRTTDQMDYMAFPRLSALAEVMWTPEKQKSWDGFKERMEYQYKRYEDLGINYSKSAYNVYFDIKKDSLPNSSAVISLSTDSYQPHIYYTLDGSDPTSLSRKYTGSFTVKPPITIKAANFNGGDRISKINQKTIIK